MLGKMYICQEWVKNTNKNSHLPPSPPHRLPLFCFSFTPSFLLKRNHKCTKVIINLVPINNSLSLHCLVRFGHFDLNDCQQNKTCGNFSYYVYFLFNFVILQVSLDQSTLLKVEVIFFSHYILKQVYSSQ